MGKTAMAAECPTRSKQLFITRAEARTFARRSRCCANAIPYLCDCGYWHLTTRRNAKQRRMK